MYPGSNNYPGSPPSHPGYNPSQMPYGNQRGPPPIGFNIGGGPAQGYNAGPAQGYNVGPAQGYNAEPTQGYNAGPAQGYNVGPAQGYNAGPAQAQGYNAPQHQTTQAYASQGQYIPGQSGQQYPQGQAPGSEFSQIHKPQVPIQAYPTSANQQMIMDCIGSGGETYKGVIKPFPNFNAEQDSNVLKKAMKGAGTDEKAIIECLGRRNLAQRLEIKKTFKTMFGKDLIDEVKSELSGNFSRAVVESLYDADYYDAYSLRKAMEGAGTREDVLTEILTSRSNQQIINIKDLYKKWFKKDLEKDVISETSGFYKRVLVSCLQANKKELTGDEIMRLRQQGPSAVVNVALAKQEAQELYNAGEKKMGTDEACFIRVFASRNKYQLRATFDEYKKVSQRDILSSIEREMSGDLASSLKAIALQAIDPALYFATRLYKSMKGLGTNDTTLIRLLLTRSEIDMENIKAEFLKQYKKTLESFIRGDTSGDYQKYLMRFVDGN